jgi:hypothetical protein
MIKHNLTDYYQELHPYFHVFGTMLDVGCNNLNFLFQYDDSEFDNLVGIDIVLPDDPFQNYLEFKNPNLLELDYEYLLKRFNQKYKFYEENIINYQIKNDSYGFIFCKHVIHFIQHNLQIDVISKLYNGLRIKGILFLKINHNQNKDYKALNIKRIAKSTFFNEKRKIIHYPCDSEKLIKILKNKFDPESISEDNKSITAIIRKK